MVKSLFFPGAVLTAFLTCHAQSGALPAADSLIRRILPAGQANDIILDSLSSADGKDAFEIEQAPRHKIILRGNTGVALASALYYYLNEYCHFQITWNGERLNFFQDQRLPEVPVKIHRTTPYAYRYYLNYCTFNYSMSWWDWPRWEKEIDWMALHGINTPLAITGEEYTWYTVYKEMGFSDEELQAFFSGPAYFAWGWMGNLDGWGGPLPLSWIKSHAELQKKILQRQRSLGMKPVLPAFTGHVPAAFAKHFPSAKIKSTNWKNGFADTYILDPSDPLFATIGKKFLETQTRIFGTDHLYSSDTFNENEPPSDDPAFLADLSRRLYEGMRSADTAAIWVMQGWLFYSDRKFWNAPQIKALLDAVPNEHMLLLDLAAEIEPVWRRTEARAAGSGSSEGPTSFYGKPWIWCMLHNFGGNISMFGRMDGVATGPAAALHDAASGRMQGIGLTMEGIGQNPVLYELMTTHVWRDSVIDPGKWLTSYVTNRYGHADKQAIAAWKILRNTVYNGKEIRDGAESIITGRPTLSAATVWTRTRLNYNPSELLPAWDLFMEAAPACHNSDGFQYDLADITRQALANYAHVLREKWLKAYREKNSGVFAEQSGRFLELIDDMDRLLATRKDFLLGPWIADARHWGATPGEKDLYERNARDLITLWGDANSPLHEYSCRQWSGLLTDFYKARWQQFFQLLQNCVEGSLQPDLEAFDKKISAWEWEWVNSRKDYPTSPSGKTVSVAQQLYKKYRGDMARDMYDPH
ncbi:MAG TPA: alpha-N-acetylglucosaminidase [Puia sp.]|nr:alpha-N-acetylglucosaminidase [Puia sp.]